MTTEILNQLTHITNEIKEIYGEDYSNQYCNVALNLINEHFPHWLLKGKELKEYISDNIINLRGSKDLNINK